MVFSTSLVNACQRVLTFTFFLQPVIFLRNVKKIIFKRQPKSTFWKNLYFSRGIGGYPLFSRTFLSTCRIRSSICRRISVEKGTTKSDFLDSLRWKRPPEYFDKQLSLKREIVMSAKRLTNFSSSVLGKRCQCRMPWTNSKLKL